MRCCSSLPGQARFSEAENSKIVRLDNLRYDSNQSSHLSIQCPRKFICELSIFVLAHGVDYSDAGTGTDLSDGSILCFKRVRVKRHCPPRHENCPVAQGPGPTSIPEIRLTETADVCPVPAPCYPVYEARPSGLGVDGGYIEASYFRTLVHCKTAASV